MERDERAARQPQVKNDLARRHADEIRFSLFAVIVAAGPQPPVSLSASGI